MHKVNKIDGYILRNRDKRNPLKKEKIGMYRHNTWVRLWTERREQEREQDAA